MPAEYGFSKIHIVESLGELDGNPGRRLAAALAQCPGRTRDFPISIVEVFERRDFFAELDRLYREEIVRGVVPALHFETHGCEEGLELRNHEIVRWHELYPILARINLATRFNLLVAHACCHGINQIKILTAFRVRPFSACLGCEGEIFTDELLNGYKQFYDILINEGRALKALALLQAAAPGHPETRFSLLTCQRAFESVYSHNYRVRHAPGHEARRVEFYRRIADKNRALNGDLRPTDPAEIARILASADEKFLRRFYMNFLAIGEIPENAQRFDYYGMRERAIAAATA
jgi:hypothetical protein